MTDDATYTLGVQRQSDGKAIGWTFSAKGLDAARYAIIAERDARLRNGGIDLAVELTHLIALFGHALDSCDQDALERTLTT